MGAVVNKGKPVPQKKEPGKEGSQSNNNSSKQGESICTVQLVCKHGGEEESRAYNTSVDIKRPVKEVVQFLQQDVVKDRIFEILTSNSVRITDTVAVPQKVQVVDGPSVYNADCLSINVNSSFGRFYNSFYKSKKAENKKRLPVQVVDQGLLFGKEKGMLLTFTRCNTSGVLQDSNYPMCKISNFQDSVPEQWRKESGVFIGVWPHEACWPVFHAGFAPYAVQVKAGNSNALTGRKWEEKLSLDPQNYVVCPPQNILPHLKASGKAPVQHWGLQSQPHSTLRFDVFPMKRKDVCFRRSGETKPVLDGDWNLGETPAKAGLKGGDEIYMFSLHNSRLATLADFGIAANSQIIARAVRPSEIKIFVQVSIPSQKASKFFPVLIDPAITVAELKFLLASQKKQNAELYLKCFVYFNGKMLLADQHLKHHGVKDGSVLNIAAGDYSDSLCEDDSLLNWDVNRAARVIVRLVSSETFKSITKRDLPPPSDRIPSSPSNKTVPSSPSNKTVAAKTTISKPNSQATPPQRRDNVTPPSKEITEYHDPPMMTRNLPPSSQNRSTVDETHEGGYDAGAEGDDEDDDNQERPVSEPSPRRTQLGVSFERSEMSPQTTSAHDDDLETEELENQSSEENVGYERDDGSDDSNGQDEFPVVNGENDGSDEGLESSQNRSMRKDLNTTVASDWDQVEETGEEDDNLLQSMGGQVFNLQTNAPIQRYGGADSSDMQEEDEADDVSYHSPVMRSYADVMDEI